MGKQSLVERFRSWLAGLLFLAAGRLDSTYDVWLDDAPPRHPTAPREEPEPSVWNIDADGMPHGSEWWRGYAAALRAAPREETPE